MMNCKGGSAISEHEVLEYIMKQAKYAGESKPVSRTLPWLLFLPQGFCLSFVLTLMLNVNVELYTEINPFFPKLLLLIVFCDSNRKPNCNRG